VGLPLFPVPAGEGGFYLFVTGRKFRKDDNLEEYKESGSLFCFSLMSYYLHSFLLTQYVKYCIIILECE